MNHQLFKKLAIPASQFSQYFRTGTQFYNGQQVEIFNCRQQNYPVTSDEKMYKSDDLIVPLYMYDYFHKIQDEIYFMYGSEYFIKIAEQSAVDGETTYLSEHLFIKEEVKIHPLDFNPKDLVAWVCHPEYVKSLRLVDLEDDDQMDFMAANGEDLFENPDEYKLMQDNVQKEIKKWDKDAVDELVRLAPPDKISPNAAHVGLRYNGDKDRLDLLSPYALKQAARVMTKGAKKYKLRNWENGLSLSETAGSLLRHITSWMAGEDYDEETGELHMAHAMVNTMMITHLQKYYPQGDDRPHQYLKERRIALDIDEVLCDWVKYWCEHHQQDIPHHWIFDRDLIDKLSVKKDDKEFWLNIPPLINGSELPFDPVMYVTKRPIPNEWTQEWLDKNGFPHVPCITLQPAESKLQTLLDHNITEYIDDNFDTFRELNMNGIVCYLMDAQHNRKHNVGTKRIFNLKDIM